MVNNTLFDNTETPHKHSKNLLFYVIRLMGAGFILFFGSAIALILFKLDHLLLQSEVGQVILRLVRWGELNGGSEHYELMISVIYVVWGFYLWLAATRPLSNKIFLDFTMFANIAHFGLMLAMGIFVHGEHLHLVGDVLLGWVILIIFILVWLPARNKVPNTTSEN